MPSVCSHEDNIISQTIYMGQKTRKPKRVMRSTEENGEHKKFFISAVLLCWNFDLWAIFTLLKGLFLFIFIYLLLVLAVSFILHPLETESLSLLAWNLSLIILYWHFPKGTINFHYHVVYFMLIIVETIIVLLIILIITINIYIYNIYPRLYYLFSPAIISFQVSGTVLLFQPSFPGCFKAGFEEHHRNC